MCSSCRTKIRRHRAKLAAIAHMGGKCERCGWDAHPIGFEFHHKEDETKEFTIGKISNKSWAVIVKELKKCELLCSCCHRIHHSDRDNPKFLEAVSNYKGELVLAL